MLGVVGEGLEEAVDVVAPGPLLNYTLLPARATTASFAWLHSRRSSVPTLTAAPTPSATTAMTPLPAVRGLKRVGTIWMNSTNKKGSPKSCAMLGNGLSGPRNWAWPGCYCCCPWPAPLHLPRLRKSPGYLPVLRLLMASSRPPGRRLLQRLPIHPKPRLKEPGKSKPRTTTRRTLPNPYREGAEPVETARWSPTRETAMKRRRPPREAAEPAAMTRLLPIPDKTAVELPQPGFPSRRTGGQRGSRTGHGPGSRRGCTRCIVRSESVAVTIYLSGSVDEVVAFLEENGGDPRNVGEDYVEAYVPVSLLGPVSDRPGVIRVREIVPPERGQGG